MKLVCIYDKQSGYNAPMVQETEGSAIRWFGELCNDEKNMIHKHPKDFSLLVIGDFDVKTGIQNANEVHEIATASQFVPEIIN